MKLEPFNEKEIKIYFYSIYREKFCSVNYVQKIVFWFKSWIFIY